MKIGDLVCYNAAGQKHKTLGVVYDFTEGHNFYGPDQPLVLIQWCVVGDVMPRTNEWFPGVIESGSMLWHVYGAWFEVVK